jgi:hypothetical protein
VTINKPIAFASLIILSGFVYVILTVFSGVSIWFWISPFLFIALVLPENLYGEKYFEFLCAVLSSMILASVAWYASEYTEFRTAREETLRYNLETRISDLNQELRFAEKLKSNPEVEAEIELFYSENSGDLFACRFLSIKQGHSSKITVSTNTSSKCSALWGRETALLQMRGEKEASVGKAQEKLAQAKRDLSALSPLPEVEEETINRFRLFWIPFLTLNVAALSMGLATRKL